MAVAISRTLEVEYRADLSVEVDARPHMLSPGGGSSVCRTAGRRLRSPAARGRLQDARKVFETAYAHYDTTKTA